MLKLHTKVHFKKQTAYPCKIGSSGFDMKVQKIKDDPVRQISEASVVHNESLASIDHLYLVS